MKQPTLDITSPPADKIKLDGQTWPWHEIILKAGSHDQVPVYSAMAEVLTDRKPWPLILKRGKAGITSKWGCPVCGEANKKLIPYEGSGYTERIVVRSCPCGVQVKIDTMDSTARVFRIYRVKPGRKSGRIKGKQIQIQ